ncbi:lysophospholipid acyltransferase family protein [Thiohalomonas denitrificans]|uniref:lysophospholipid acyltransferase family protein n=1 Tax=Thiohalomonas denitrificans TaxID=415747 RepID=UPI0026EAD71F|nr:lysophospholipid acyltransferase family protein [Thiohalomonas denitrificans]
MNDKKPGARLPPSPYLPPFSRHFLGPRYWGLWIGLGFLWLLSYLPGSLRRRLGAWVGDQAFRRNHKRRAIVETNLAWCFPEKNEAERRELAVGFFRNMGRCMFDYGALWWGSQRRLKGMLDLEGEEHLRPHLEAGRPVILLTCHHVTLDAAGLAYNLRHPAASIFKEGRNDLLNWFIARGRSRLGGLNFEREESMRPVVKATRSGYALFYLPDEDLGPDRSVFAPFFGIPAATIPTLSRLTKLCRAAVVPFMAYYHPETGHYTARLLPALEGYPSGDEVADAAHMNRAIEEIIRLAPEQYMWSLRIFQTRPDGSPPPYEMASWPGSGHRERPEG